MSDSLKVLQVFIASPNDLPDERRAIKEVADELNATFGRSVGLQIQLLGWEDRLPGFGRAQAQINEDVDKADLFVGFLWRRWGSDPGDPKYTSGFEEEFNRAVERRERSGSPEICLFFKAVKITSAGEIDDQLKRVFEFRDTVASKKLLFGEFTTIEEWRKKTRDVLEGHLLRLLKSLMASQERTQPQAPPVASPEGSSTAATGRKDQVSAAAAKQQVVGIWVEALEAIKRDELSSLGKSKALEKLKVARLGLAVAGMANRDIEVPDLPAVHLTNLLFRSRKQVVLTPVEWLPVLRANLMPNLGYQPGWYWLRKTSLNVKEALMYLACFDEHRGVRAAALGYATKLNLSLLTKTRRRGAAIPILCGHEDPFTRKAGLEYLAKRGTTKELAVVEKLRHDSDGDVRAQAERTCNAILLRDDASKFFETSVLASPWISEDGMRAVEEYAARIGDLSLRTALTHPDTKVAAFAAKELIARGSITLEEVEPLKTGEAAAEVFGAYFSKAISEGTKFSPKIIRDSLRPGAYFAPGLLGHSRADANEILIKLFKLYAFEELKAIVETPSEDAAVAYRVLAEKHFDKFGDEIRADLKTDFAVLRSKNKKTEETALNPPYGFLGLIGEAKPDISDFTVGALSGIASHGDSADRVVVLPFLENKPERVRAAALNALRRVGQAEDGDAVLRIAEEEAKDLAIEAAKTALVLMPGERGGACSDPNNVWPMIEHRLYDGDDEIRKLVCAYVIRKFPVNHLAKLLNNYFAKDAYFYNVVHFLDRAIYARLPLRRVFLKEIDEFLS